MIVDPLMHRALYNIFLHAFAAPFLLGYYAPRILFQGKYRKSIAGKFGRLPEDFPLDSLKTPRIWFHAVSVGEAAAMAPLIRSFREIHTKGSIIVSTGTETGQEKARFSIPEADAFLFLPLDFPEFLNPVIRAIKPDLFVLMETELWPNLIYSLKKAGSLAVLANGRISDRSFPRYKLLKSFFAPILRQMDLFLASSEIDAFRLAAMGAPEQRIRVTGSTKFDAVTVDSSPDTEAGIRDLLNLRTRCLLAGSTHTGEDEIILAAFKALLTEFPDLALIIVPRHVERTPKIIGAVESAGLGEPFLRSSISLGCRREKEKVIILDRMGELFQTFSVASVVFMGGSLVKKGGQNILEPAAWGKPVLFGPSMEDFRDARDMLLRCGSAEVVAGTDDLVKRVAEILRDENKWQILGSKGRSEILKHSGSSKRNAEFLAGLLNIT